MNYLKQKWEGKKLVLGHTMHFGLNDPFKTQLVVKQSKRKWEISCDKLDIRYHSVPLCWFPKLTTTLQSDGQERKSSLNTSRGDPV